MAIEEGELLLAVGGVVGGIEVDRDAGGAALEPPSMVRNDGVRQHVAHRDQLARPHGILEPRQRGLRGQGRPREGIALEQELVDRVVGQPGGVVAVGVTAGEAEGPLPEQLDRLVLDLARLTTIRQARSQALGQRGHEPMDDGLDRDGQAEPGGHAGDRLRGEAAQARRRRLAALVEFLEGLCRLLDDGGCPILSRYGHLGLDVGHS